MCLLLNGSALVWVALQALERRAQEEEGKVGDEEESSRTEASVDATSANQHQHQQSAPAAPVATAPQGGGAQQQKRGQKGKLKRKKGRYADQDEEDGALLATVLAAQGPQRGKAERRAERKAKKAERKQTGIDVRCASRLLHSVVTFVLRLSSDCQVEES